ncbi:hypothetical protein [Rhodococcus sp. NPDC049939]|uniref:hypothetical protein n=1 Tax=Rhodococcus sp. NPDC049939 TaxID=3155511 RepID=UPI0033EF8D1E
MNTADRDPNGFISAMFSYEFLDDGVDYSSIEQIHQGEFDEWISALAGSGLFTNSEIRSIHQTWRMNPRTLFDALLADADEVTARRCEVIWAALEEVSPSAAGTGIS